MLVHKGHFAVLVQDPKPKPQHRCQEHFLLSIISYKQANYHMHHNIYSGIIKLHSYKILPGLFVSPTGSGMFQQTDC